MKKLLLTLLALILAMPMSVSAQNNKMLEKARKKEFKTKMKEYKKENWKIFGTTRSLDVSLLTHYDKLDKLGENGYELIGTASNFKSKSVGIQMAANNACVSYAKESGMRLRARIVGDLNANGSDADMEFDKFYQAYEAKVEAEIKGELQKSFSIIKDNGDGTFELQTFFIVNQDAATKARIRAMENALKESEAAQKYARKISDFVQEAFQNEETE